MRLIVADTSPIFYLLSVDQIDLLPRLFEMVFIPDAVHRELCHPAAPAVLREWVTEQPLWLKVMPVNVTTIPRFSRSATVNERPSGAIMRSAVSYQLSAPLTRLRRYPLNH